jgi:hypothetical protein
MASIINQHNINFNKINILIKIFNLIYLAVIFNLFLIILVKILNKQHFNFKYTNKASINN